MRSVISFEPAMQCAMCERWTTQGQWNDELEPALEPLCFEHAYWMPENRSQQELGRERQSIRDFVVGIHANKGKARIVRSVDPVEVPGYSVVDLDPFRLLPPPPDLAWYVRHGRENKKGRYGWVIWYAELFSFAWVRERKQPEAQEGVAVEQAS